MTALPSGAQPTWWPLFRDEAPEMLVADIRLVLKTKSCRLRETPRIARRLGAALAVDQGNYRRLEGPMLVRVIRSAPRV